MVAEQVLLNISFVLVLAFLIYLLGRFLKVPEILLLILAGYVLGNVEYPGFLPITFSSDLVYSISVFALLFIIFTGNIKVRFNILDKYSLSMLKFIGVFMLFEMILFTLALHFVTKMSWEISVLVAIITTGASPLVVNLFSHLKNKAALFLNLETELPSFEAILAFIFFDIFLSPNNGSISTLIIDNAKFILLKLVIGLGAGVFIALITYKAMKNHYHQLYTPLGILCTILASYFLAKSFGGSGVLSLTTTSIILGNLYVENIKKAMLPINFLTKIFYLLVGIAIGTFIHIPQELMFFVVSIYLYFVFLVIRYLVVNLVMNKELKTLGEKLTFTLGGAKGFGAVTLATLIIQSGFPGAEKAFIYLISFLFYSIVLSSIIALITNLLQPYKSLRKRSNKA